MRNHSPKDYGKWVSYTGFRFKDMYDIKLIDGTIVKGCRPNADMWTVWYDRTQCEETEFHDTDVLEIRLMPDEELEEWDATGEWRLKRNCRMFGINYDELL